jgi:hypothetical protein
MGTTWRQLNAVRTFTDAVSGCARTEAWSAHPAVSQVGNSVQRDCSWSNICVEKWSGPALPNAVSICSEPADDHGFDLPLR